MDPINKEWSLQKKTDALVYLAINMYNRILKSDCYHVVTCVFLLREGPRSSACITAPAA